MNVPVVQRTVTDLINEYDLKASALEQEMQDFNDAQKRLEMAVTVQGKYAGPPFDRAYLDERRLRKNLLQSGWKSIYDRLQIDRIASAKDKKLFERAIEDPAELTFENAKATFGDYLARPRFHLLRGLAETFADLDPAYKSHSKVKIGVKGLPKRVILSSYGSYYGAYGRDKLRDIVNALASYRGQPLMDHDEYSAIDVAHRAGEDAILDGRTYTSEPRYGRAQEYETKDRGITIRKFQNGNAHVIFDKQTLLDINRALAEFYGDVLPDVEEDGAARQPGTSVSKDLQYYWSPQSVIDRALDIAGIYARNNYGHGTQLPEYRVLEPSCGDGRFLDSLRERGCRSFGIEVHPARSAQARAKGHSVLTANFLECPPKEEFDFVVMNPPFYGRHYVKHVKHALKFLKPSGKLVSVLPATAWYDHKELSGQWVDLPVGSFAESGTNVPTGILCMQAERGSVS